MVERGVSMPLVRWNALMVPPTRQHPALHGVQPRVGPCRNDADAIAEPLAHRRSRVANQERRLTLHLPWGPAPGRPVLRAVARLNALPLCRSPSDRSGLRAAPRTTPRSRCGRSPPCYGSAWRTAFVGCAAFPADGAGRCISAPGSASAPPAATVPRGPGRPEAPESAQPGRASPRGPVRRPRPGAGRPRCP